MSEWMIDVIDLWLTDILNWEVGAASLVHFSLKLLFHYEITRVKMPFTLRYYDVSDVIFWEAKVMSWFYILGIDVSISVLAWSRSW